MLQKLSLRASEAHFVKREAHLQVVTAWNWSLQTSQETQLAFPGQILLSTDSLTRPEKMLYDEKKHRNGRNGKNGGKVWCSKV